ncbi:MAG: cell division protein CrgA [Actinomycetota bacterium]|nr:cell division protein CrgA [Actinomycetota bacterium]
MPKSKVRKKVATASASSSAQANSTAYTTARVQVSGPSGPVYIGIMLGLMVLGLLWLVVNYLWGQHIGFLASLGNWNFAIGFGLMVAGLLMTMRWR